jgi:hypothetical protein
MLVELMIYAAQPLDDADQLAAAWTKCLFAASRTAQAQGQSLNAFQATLSYSCLGEEAAVRRATVAALVARGESRDVAQESISRAIAEGREAVIRAYSWGTAN